MSNDNLQEVEKLNFRPFTRFCMSIGAVPSSYLAGLTIEEQMLWLCSYLEKEVIGTVNNNAEAVEELQDLYVQLHDYVEHYFDNLDVQEEINNKLDSMTEDGTLTRLIGNYVDPIQQEYENHINSQINDFENTVNAKLTSQDNIIANQNVNINTIDAKVNAIEDKNPIPVSSTSDMTDITQIYVNTTDGKWYYYDGDSWEIGGTYQSTGISDNYINKYMLNSNLQGTVYKQLGTKNLKLDGEVTNFNSSSTAITESAQYKSIVIPIIGGHTYKCSKLQTSTTRFTITTCPDYPVAAGSIGQRVTTTYNFDNRTYSYITAENTDNYLIFYFYLTSDTSINYDSVLNSIVIEDTYNYSQEYGYPKAAEDYAKKVEYDLLNNICINKGSENIFNPFNETQYQAIMPSGTDSYYVNASGICSIILPLLANTTYIVKRKIIGSRFQFSLCNEYPFPRKTDFYGNTTNNSGDTLTINNTSYSYAVILFYRQESDSAIMTLEQAKESISIYVGSSITQPSYIFDNVLSDKYINLLSYRPLGTLTKGYIAISCDDGRNELADITIPLFEGYKTEYNKNIPLTMGLMSTSEIFSDDTRTDTVSDFITDTGSSVAIHGSASYTEYTQTGLYEFLDQQKLYLTTNLTAPSSIIYPNHDYNTLSSTIAGSYYGVCCTGGTYEPITYGGDNIKVAGSRSNMYTLYRFSLFNETMTNAKIKDAIDYAYDNNMIFLPFFHDHNLTTDYARCKALLDYCVDYANSKGLEFINVGDIPNIK